MIKLETSIIQSVIEIFLLSLASAYLLQMVIWHGENMQFMSYSESVSVVSKCG